MIVPLVWLFVCCDDDLCLTKGRLKEHKRCLVASVWKRIVIKMGSIWRFKSINLGRELEVAGEFLFESAKRAISLDGFSSEFEINSILYNGAVGVERLQKILLCLYCIKSQADFDNPLKCLKEHNHLDLYEKINEYKDCGFQKKHVSLLGVFRDYYADYRYGNYYLDKNADVRSLLLRVFRMVNKKEDFDNPMTDYQRKPYIKFYIDLLGEIARKYFSAIRERASLLNVYTYEIDSLSNAMRVFSSVGKKSFYEEMLMERICLKEFLLFLYKQKQSYGVFKVMNDTEELDFDPALTNDFIHELSKGKVDEFLIDSAEEFYNELGAKKAKERKSIIDIIGSKDVLWDDEEY